MVHPSDLVTLYIFFCRSILCYILASFYSNWKGLEGPSNMCTEMAHQSSTIRQADFLVCYYKDRGVDTSSLEWCRPLVDRIEGHLYKYKTSGQHIADLSTCDRFKCERHNFEWCGWRGHLQIQWTLNWVWWTREKDARTALYSVAFCLCLWMKNEVPSFFCYFHLFELLCRSSTFNWDSIKFFFSTRNKRSWRRI